MHYAYCELVLKYLHRLSNLCIRSYDSYYSMHTLLEYPYYSMDTTIVLASVCIVDTSTLASMNTLE